jgi:nucleoside-diphosphate-sugar epimerase
MTQISILGCGWLGLPLAKTFLQKRHVVNGSTTSLAKLSVLKNSGIQPYLITLESKNIAGDLAHFLKGSKTLIIDIPPKLRGTAKEDFVGKIETLIPFIVQSAIKKVLFISSTSVYGDDHSVVTEETIPRPETESGKQLVQAEQLLQKNSNFKTTILRFGGLIGEDRHPIQFLAGRKNIENPHGPINLIHQEDCIAVIHKILETNSWNETYNAVSPFHPDRKSYYSQKAIELNLPLPEFDSSKPAFGKTILSTKVEKELNYTFTKPRL